MQHWTIPYPQLSSLFLCDPLPNTPPSPVEHPSGNILFKQKSNLYVSIYIYIYICIYRERDRDRDIDRERETENSNNVCVHIYIYIYTYIAHSWGSRSQIAIRISLGPSGLPAERHPGGRARC